MLELTKKQADRLKDFLQWNDKNGCYTDKNCELEGFKPLTDEEVLLYVFDVLNEDKFIELTYSIQELSIDEVIEFSKKKGFYENTIEKIEKLKENYWNVTLYKSLI